MLHASAALWAARLLGLVGFLDATYLTVSHLSGGEVACGPTGGCDVVLASRWATIGDVPIAALGVAYYAVASLLAWTPRAAWRRGVAWALVVLTGTATGISAFLFWLQAAVIDAWCRFCLVSAGITSLLFVTAIILLGASTREPLGGEWAPE